MAGTYLMASMALVLGSGAAFAAEPRAVQGAIYGIGGAAASSAVQSRRLEDGVRAAIFATSMAGTADIAGTATKRETQRRLAADSSAEAALLAGAGLLSTAPHLSPFALCLIDERREECAGPGERRKKP